MNSFKKIMLVAGLLLIVPVKSEAAFLTNEKASFDWSQFSYSGDITIHNPQSGVQVSNNSFQSINSLGDTEDSFSDTGLSEHAATTASLVIADIEVQSNNEDKDANATALRGFEFSVLSRGIVSFSVPYELELNSSAATEGESYTGLSLVYAFLDDSATIALDEIDQAELQSQLESLTLADTGILNVSHEFEAGDTGFFSVFSLVAAQVEAASPVPEPASLMLFGLSLLGFLGISKKS